MEIFEGEMIIGCQNREPSMVVFFGGGIHQSIGTKMVVCM